MFPDFFSIHSITLHGYGLSVALGFVLALLLTLIVGRSAGIGVQLIADMGVYVILAAIVGARFMYVLVNLEYFKVHPLDAIKVWRGGLVFSGGVIAVLIAVFSYARCRLVSFWEFGDLWAPGAALGQTVGWIFFMADCCFGSPAGPPLKVLFTDPYALARQNVPLCATQVFSAAGGFVMTIVLLMIHGKKKFPGQVLVWYLIFHGTISLFIDKYRGDNVGLMDGPMSASQAVSLLLLSGAVIALFVLKWKKSPPKIASG